MLFLSHNCMDKEIVEPFANRLAEVFGRDNVFYDSWSIQPGDGVIDKMDEGLTRLHHFFFFVSGDSLKSKMVKLEWQNALIKAMKNDIKFIPIRLDQSEMPAILKQILYLDVFTNGFEVVLRQMIDVVNGNSIFHGDARTYENVKSHVKVLSEKEIEIEIFAITYMEPISRYVVLVTNSKGDISWSSPTDSMIMVSFNKNLSIKTSLGKMLVNGLATTIQRATTPSFPVRIRVKSKTKVDFKGIMRATSDETLSVIPYRFI